MRLKGKSAAAFMVALADALNQPIPGAIRNQAAGYPAAAHKRDVLRVFNAYTPPEKRKPGHPHANKRRSGQKGAVK